MGGGVKAAAPCPTRSLGVRALGARKGRQSRGLKIVNVLPWTQILTSWSSSPSPFITIPSCLPIFSHNQNYVLLPPHHLLETFPKGEPTGRDELAGALSGTKNTQFLPT